MLLFSNFFRHKLQCKLRACILSTCFSFSMVMMMMFAFSIHGENKHYGTPINPVVPARVPGGSCSGAAVAVAANLVDFSLGELRIASLACL